MSESGCVKSLGSKTLIIRSSFIKICSDTRLQRQLQNKWLPAKIWVEAQTKSLLIDQTLTSSICVGAFNSAMGRSKGDFGGQMMSRHDGTTTRIFWLTFQRAIYCIVADKNAQVPNPDLMKVGREKCPEQPRTFSINQQHGHFQMNYCYHHKVCFVYPKIFCSLLPYLLLHTIT
jgi:hypothetical protein